MIWQKLTLFLLEPGRFKTDWGLQINRQAENVSFYFNLSEHYTDGVFLPRLWVEI